MMTLVMRSESRRLRSLRRWAFGLAVLCFIALWGLSSTHLHVKDAGERECGFCSAVAHNPPADIAAPLPALSPIGALGEPAFRLFAETHRASIFTPFSRAPPRA